MLPHEFLSLNFVLYWPAYAYLCILRQLESIEKKVFLKAPARWQTPSTASQRTHGTAHDIVHRQRALFYSRNHENTPQLRNCDSIFDNFLLNSALTDWIVRQVEHWKMSSICFSQVFKALFTTKANLLSIDSCHKVVCQKSYVILTLKIIFQIF